MSVQISASEHAARGLARTGAMIDATATAVVSAWEGVFAAAHRKQRAERPRSYPGRCGYLDDAAMCREMRRL